MNEYRFIYVKKRQTNKPKDLFFLGKTNPKMNNQTNN